MRKSESRRRLIESLRSALGPVICEALDDPDVVEVMVNPDGRVYIERLAASAVLAATLPAEHTELVIGKVAHALSVIVTSNQPVISGELPIGGHRFEGIVPPAAPAAMFTIRKRASVVFSLESYVSEGTMTAPQARAIRQAISERKNIIVSGGTGTGKTTLTNAILAELVTLEPAARLIIIEDTAEIRCLAANQVTLHTTNAMDMARLLKSTLRLRPDRIIVGEVRDGAALTLLKAWNTGHPGGVATVHSNSALAALTRLEQLVAEVASQPMPQIIGEAVDLVVSMVRGPNGRIVREVLAVDEFCNGAYRFTPIGNAKSDNIQGTLHVA